MERYQERFQYILVDEYQDTNSIQYELVKLLAKKYKNIFVVGDANQSIYSWRNADYRNILNFERDYENAHVVLLISYYASRRDKCYLNCVQYNTSTIKKSFNRPSRAFRGLFHSLFSTSAFDLPARRNTELAHRLVWHGG